MQSLLAQVSEYDEVEEAHEIHLPKKRSSSSRGRKKKKLTDLQDAVGVGFAACVWENCSQLLWCTPIVVSDGDRALNMPCCLFELEEHDTGH